MATSLLTSSDDRAVVIGEREPALSLVGTSRSECHAEVGERGVTIVLQKPWTIDSLMREVRR